MYIVILRCMTFVFGLVLVVGCLANIGDNSLNNGLVAIAVLGTTLMVASIRA